MRLISQWELFVTSGRGNVIARKEPPGPDVTSARRAISESLSTAADVRFLSFQNKQIIPGCDECVFHLITDIDRMDSTFSTLNHSIGNISSATVVGARLTRNKKQLTELQGLSNLLTNTDSDYNNLIGDAKGAVTDRANQLATANRSLSLAAKDVEQVHNLTDDAEAALQKIKDHVEVVIIHVPY